MKRLPYFVIAVFVLGAPSVALASPLKEIPEVPSMLQWVMSIFGMVIAVFGLYMISGISKLTKGGAISGNAHFIVLAFVCLGVASVLTIAVYSFDLNISDAYIAHLESALRIVSMGFFLMYFYNILGGLKGYMKAMGEDAAASEPRLEEEVGV